MKNRIFLIIILYLTICRSYSQTIFFPEDVEFQYTNNILGKSIVSGDKLYKITDCLNNIEKPINSRNQGINITTYYDPDSNPTVFVDRNLREFYIKNKSYDSIELPSVETELVPVNILIDINNFSVNKLDINSVSIKDQYYNDLNTNPVKFYNHCGTSIISKTTSMNRIIYLFTLYTTPDNKLVLDFILGGSDGIWKSLDPLESVSELLEDTLSPFAYKIVHSKDSSDFQNDDSESEVFHFDLFNLRSLIAYIESDMNSKIYTIFNGKSVLLSFEVKDWINTLTVTKTCESLNGNICDPLKDFQRKAIFLKYKKVSNIFQRLVYFSHNRSNLDSDILARLPLKSEEDSCLSEFDMYNNLTTWESIQQCIDAYSLSDGSSMNSLPSCQTSLVEINDILFNSSCQKYESIDYSRFYYTNNNLEKISHNNQEVMDIPGLASVLIDENYNINQKDSCFQFSVLLNDLKPIYQYRMNPLMEWKRDDQFVYFKWTENHGFTYRYKSRPSIYDINQFWQDIFLTETVPDIEDALLFKSMCGTHYIHSKEAEKGFIANFIYRVPVAELDNFTSTGPLFNNNEEYLRNISIDYYGLNQEFMNNVELNPEINLNFNFISVYNLHRNRLIDSVKNSQLELSTAINKTLQLESWDNYFYSFNTINYFAAQPCQISSYTEDEQFIKCSRELNRFDSIIE